MVRASSAGALADRRARRSANEARRVHGRAGVQHARRRHGTRAGQRGGEVTGTGYGCGKKLSLALRYRNATKANVANFTAQLFDANGAKIGASPAITLPVAKTTTVMVESFANVSGRVGELAIKQVSTAPSGPRGAELVVTQVPAPWAIKIID
jgi:hypothetical protein